MSVSTLASISYAHMYQVPEIDFPVAEMCVSLEIRGRVARQGGGGSMRADEDDVLIGQTEPQPLSRIGK